LEKYCTIYKPQNYFNIIESADLIQPAYSYKWMFCTIHIMPQNFVEPAFYHLICFKSKTRFYDLKITFTKYISAIRFSIRAVNIAMLYTLLRCQTSYYSKLVVSVMYQRFSIAT